MREIMIQNPAKSDTIDGIITWLETKYAVPIPYMKSITFASATIQFTRLLTMTILPHEVTFSYAKSTGTPEYTIQLNAPDALEQIEGYLDKVHGVRRISIG
jgi:hypothetical protein